ncbi:Mycoplasma protein of unknown function, DUF285 [Seminavis robusta]|uniref:BspA family leucine-rich repeat surface protein n=1 Tax=Seminavis robusta TaxID=568900 RepID=A0A9N8D8P2_9STRA|nr:Mycoplasma protein of unknown function, DUF285 [Seminavis robusta]|eukprot:Sro39_g023980.1 Mycoplasma protein of unknown function, DUF285 (114) ;mRNA; r:23739-24434
MSQVFESETTFDTDISSWDVSNVKNMNSMFLGASTFNQNIRQWDVGAVTDFGFMFSDATSFNQNLCEWGDHITAPAPTVDVSGMFLPSGPAGSCLTTDPDLSTSPKGPFCQSC